MKSSYVRYKIKKDILSNKLYLEKIQKILKDWGYNYKNIQSELKKLNINLNIDENVNIIKLQEKNKILQCIILYLTYYFLEVDFYLIFEDTIYENNKKVIVPEYIKSSIEYLRINFNYIFKEIRLLDDEFYQKTALDFIPQNLFENYYLIKWHDKKIDLRYIDLNLNKLYLFKKNNPDYCFLYSINKINKIFIINECMFDLIDESLHNCDFLYRGSSIYNRMLIKEIIRNFLLIEGITVNEFEVISQLNLMPGIKAQYIDIVYAILNSCNWQNAYELRKKEYIKEFAKYKNYCSFKIEKNILKININKNYNYINNEIFYTDIIKLILETYEYCILKNKKLSKIMSSIVSWINFNTIDFNRTFPVDKISEIKITNDYSIIKFKTYKLAKELCDFINKSQ